MKNSPFQAYSAYTWPVLIALSLVLTGCEPQPDDPAVADDISVTGTRDRPCTDDCELVVSLPADPALQPEVSNHEFHVRKGVEVRIVLDDEGNRPNQAATVLRFPQETPFFNRGGQPIQTVALNQAGVKTLTVRDDGVCGPPDGCKYDVDNHANEDREVLDPHVIIW